MKPDDYEIDNLDKQILSLLMDDAQLPYTEIAKKVFVSSGTIHVRMRKLKEMGIVKGSQLNIDPAKLGYDVTAFLGVYLVKSDFYPEVLKELEKLPQVISCHYTTGNYSMFVKIFCKDTRDLKNLLYDKIQRIEGIERTETFISLEQMINRPIKLWD